MKRVISFIGAMVLAAGVLVGVTATPAQAVTCQNLHVCLWTGAAYTGSLTRYGVPGGTGGTSCKSLNGSTMNNNAESMANGSPRFIQFYDSTNCTGSILTWLHHAGGPTDERSSGLEWRNRIGSFRYCPSSSPACT